MSSSIKFEKQLTPDHVWVLAFDTICQGQQATLTTDPITGEDLIALYTKAEVDQELEELREIERESCENLGIDFEDYDFDNEFYAIHMDEYLHERRTLFPSGVSGIKPEKQ